MISSLPSHMSRMKTILEKDFKDSIATPVDKPTLLRADVTSKKISTIFF